MTYKITGLSPTNFDHLFSLSDAELAALRARRVQADNDVTFPCRISLVNAPAGEELIAIHHVSHDTDTPYRSAYAILVRQGVSQAEYADTIPPVLRGRPIALRGFDGAGLLHAARLALSDDVDTQVRALFADPDIAYIDAHNAAHGCFAARIERDDA